MSGKPLSKLQAAMKAKLQGGQFRQLNEVLYTQDGNKSYEMLQKDPHLFDVYHEGYRAQVNGWPINPLDVIINEIKKLKSAVVADMGCGEARLAATLKPLGAFTVHSFDLVCPPGNPYITPTDIAHVPLGDSSVDIVVFCLSLMGSNYFEFLLEAARILKPGGQLLIAEVRSRFEDDDAGVAIQSSKRPRQSTDSQHNLQKFCSAISRLGFTRTLLNDKNTMFVLVYFRRNGLVTSFTQPFLPTGPKSSLASNQKNMTAKDETGGVDANLSNVSMEGLSKAQKRKLRKKFRKGLDSSVSTPGPTSLIPPSTQTSQSKPTGDRVDVSTFAAPPLKPCIYKRR